MSMTREEAAHILEYSRIVSENFTQEAVTATYVMALSALRPVSREQVEKVWRGEWNNINPAVLKPGVSWVCRCTKCGCPQDYKHNFCPNCGAAQTDEAVEMVMERLRVLTNDN